MTEVASTAKRVSPASTSRQSRRPLSKGATAAHASSPGAGGAKPLRDDGAHPPRRRRKDRPRPLRRLPARARATTSPPSPASRRPRRRWPRDRYDVGGDGPHPSRRGRDGGAAPHQGALPGHRGGGHHRPGQGGPRGARHQERRRRVPGQAGGARGAPARGAPGAHHARSCCAENAALRRLRRRCWRRASASPPRWTASGCTDTACAAFHAMSLGQRRGAVRGATAAAARGCWARRGWPGGRRLPCLAFLDATPRRRPGSTRVLDGLPGPWPCALAVPAIERRRSARATPCCSTPALPPEGIAEAASYLARYLALALRNLGRFAEVEDLAYLDDLTHLFNTRYLHLVLDREVKDAQQTNGVFSLLFLDLDYFKTHQRHPRAPGGLAAAGGDGARAQGLRARQGRGGALRRGRVRGAAARAPTRAAR